MARDIDSYVRVPQAGTAQAKLRTTALYKTEILMKFTKSILKVEETEFLVTHLETQRHLGAEGLRGVTCAPTE